MNSSKFSIHYECCSKLTISQKMKITKFSNLVQNQFQNIARIFWDEKKSDDSKNFNYHISTQKLQIDFLFVSETLRNLTFWPKKIGSF